MMSERLENVLNAKEKQVFWDINAIIAVNNFVESIDFQRSISVILTLLASEENK